MIIWIRDRLLYVGAEQATREILAVCLKLGYGLEPGQP
jgi:hypothetical protein